MSTAELAEPSRMDSLVLGLPADRHARIAGIADALPEGKRLLAGEKWIELATHLGSRFLDDFQINQHHLKELIRKRIADKAIIDEFGPIYGRINQKPLSAYASLPEALRFCGIDAGKAEFASYFLFDTFLSEINNRLQTLYRIFLSRNPFAEGSSEVERLAHLQSLEPHAYRLLAALEPAKLAAWLGMAHADMAVDDLLMGLSKYYFQQNRVNFRFTYHCNIQCAHCYNFSGPKLKGQSIDTKRMIDIVEGMPKAGIDAMNITGGEPFLYLDTVLELVRAARRNGVSLISMYTNGFFGKTDKQCRDVLGRLKDAGFMNALGRGRDHIKVSAGVFHQEFLSFDTIITLIRVYREIFDCNLVVDYEVLEDQREVEDEVRRKLSKDGVADLVEVRFRGIAPIGRAAQFSAKLKATPADEFKACVFIEELVIDPDCMARPCCGLNFENYGITVGDLAEDDLPAMVMRMQNNPILQFIANRPIGRIFDHVRVAPASEGYANICNLCEHALGELRENEDLKRDLSAFQDFFPFWFAAGKLASA